MSKLPYYKRQPEGWTSWQNMRRRCIDPKHPAYSHYGGRGITVCDRWLNSFDNFLKDMGEKPHGLTLERVNNDGNYEPSNCKWATRSEQQQNTRATNRFSKLDLIVKRSHPSAKNHLTHNETIAELKDLMLELIGEDEQRPESGPQRNGTSQAVRRAGNKVKAELRQKVNEL